MENRIVEKGERVYYAQIFPRLNEFNVLDLKVRMVGDTWFSALENKTKTAYIFNNSDLDNVVFKNRIEALEKARYEEEKFRE